MFRVCAEGTRGVADATDFAATEQQIASDAKLVGIYRRMAQDIAEMHEGREGGVTDSRNVRNSVAEEDDTEKMGLQAACSYLLDNKKGGKSLPSC